MKEKDNINPAHYRQQPYECIEFTENMNFNMGNAFKYIWRYQDKNGTEDLKKSSVVPEKTVGMLAIVFAVGFRTL